MTLTSNEIETLNDSGSNWGSCYYIVETNNSRYIECSVKLYDKCNGIFVQKKDCESDQMFSSIKDSDGYWNSVSLPASSFSDMDPGDNRYNSIYIGTYIPNTITLNNGIDTISTSDSNQYALFLYPAPFYDNIKPEVDVDFVKQVNISKKLPADNIAFFKKLSTDTSFYNGQYNFRQANTFGPPVNVDTNFVFGVESFFRDWYYPSIGELKFIHNQYLNNQKLRVKINSILKKTKISRSSTTFITNSYAYPELEKINKRSLYGYDFEKGKLVYINCYIKTLQFLVRYIPLV